MKYFQKHLPVPTLLSLTERPSRPAVRLAPVRFSVENRLVWARSVRFLELTALHVAGAEGARLQRSGAILVHDGTADVFAVLFGFATAHDGNR